METPYVIMESSVITKAPVTASLGFQIPGVPSYVGNCPEWQIFHKLTGRHGINMYQLSSIVLKAYGFTSLQLHFFTSYLSLGKAISGEISKQTTKAGHKASEEHTSKKTPLPALRVR